MTCHCGTTTTLALTIPAGGKLACVDADKVDADGCVHCANCGRLQAVLPPNLLPPNLAGAT